MQDNTDRDPHAPERDGQLPEPASPVSSAPTSAEPADPALANPGGTSPASPWAPRGGPWSDQHLAPSTEPAAEVTGWPGQESYHGQHSSPPATDSAAADPYAQGAASPFGQPPATEPPATSPSPYEPAAHADPGQPNGWPSWSQAGWPDQPQQIDPAGLGAGETEDDDLHQPTTQFVMPPDAKPAEPAEAAEAVEPAETDESVRGVAHVPSPAEVAGSDAEEPDEAAEQQPAAAEQGGWPQGQWPSYQQAGQQPDQPQWQPSWPPQQAATPPAGEQPAAGAEVAQPGIDPHPDLPPAYVPTEFASGHFQDGQFYPGHFQPGQQQPAYGQNAQQPVQQQPVQQQPEQQAQPADQAGWGQPATPPNWGQPAGTTYGQPAEQQPQPYDPQAGYAQYDQAQHNQAQYQPDPQNQYNQHAQYNQPGYEQQGYPQQEQQPPAPQQYPYQLGQPQQPNAGPAGTPTAADFAARRAHRPEAPKANVGLQGLVRRASFGLVKPPPGRREVEARNAIAMVRRNFGGLRQVTIVNPKGGAGKTVAVLMVAMTFGQQRGGYVLSWDNNETQGTLGMRAQQDFHARTVRDLLGELSSFTGPTGRVGDLSKFVRSQGEAMFDVLASDESATAGEMLTAQAFGQIRNVVSRFYKLIIVDTGNNVRAANWQASIEATDQLVVPMSARGDSAETASRMLDHLDQNGRHDLVRRAVSVISMPASTKGVDLPAIRAHFAARTRAVLTAPYEPLLDSGEPIRYEELSQRSRLAWLRIAAAIAEGL